MSTDALRAQLR